MKPNNIKDVVVDFDGTCVKHEFPKVGADIGAVPVLQRLVRNGYRLITSTMRSMESKSLWDIEQLYKEDNQPLLEEFDEKSLEAAVNWFVQNNIKLYGIQRNPTQERWTNSPKAYGQCIIDDVAFGIPLIKPHGERPYVDWKTVEKMMEDDGWFVNENNVNGNV